MKRCMRDRAAGKGDEVIHVCFALHDAGGWFSKYVGTAAASVFLHTRRRVMVHLLHDATLTAGNRVRFRELAASFGQRVCFYDVAEQAPQGMAMLRRILPQLVASRFSAASLYRLFLPEVLPPTVHRAVYLDADVILQEDVASLWQEPLGKSCLGAVPEQAIMGELMVPKVLCQQGLVAPERYFNSGVLLLDVARLRSRQHWLAEGQAFLLAHPGCDCPDQDVLNYFFAADYQALPVRYNRFVELARLHREPVAATGIYHYAGGQVDALQADGFMRLFWSCFVRTPWCGAKFFLRLFGEVVPAIQNQERLFSRMLFQLDPPCAWVLWGHPDEAETFRQLQQPGQSVRFLPAVDDDGCWRVDRLAADMAAHGQGCLYVLFPPAGLEVFDRLQACGFVENRDFINGRCLLRLEEGGARLDGRLLFQGL